MPFIAIPLKKMLNTVFILNVSHFCPLFHLLSDRLNIAHYLILSLTYIISIQYLTFL